MSISTMPNTGNAKNFIIFSIAILLTVSCTKTNNKNFEEWKIVSIPDFLNVDTEFPQEGWEEALSYFLKSVKSENPDFILIPGDLVMGRWQNGDSSVSYYADKYYKFWKERMNAHELDYFVLIGDHEIGDNPWPPQKAKLVLEFKAAFLKNFQLPDNGPEGTKTTYYFVHRNCLFIGMDVFESDENAGYAAKVTGEQIEWLEKILENHKDVTHKIVMGHTPVLTPIRKLSSSGITLRNGRNSIFWETLKKHDVDLYLCGEVHDITCSLDSTTEQIAHGGLFGYNDRVNYLVISFEKSSIHLELKQIRINCFGERLWQVGNNRPFEFIEIDSASGFKVVGSMVINKQKNQKSFLNMKGIFHPDSNSVEKIRKDMIKNNEYTWQKFGYRM